MKKEISLQDLVGEEITDKRHEYPTSGTYWWESPQQKGTLQLINQRRLDIMEGRFFKVKMNLMYTKCPPPQPILEEGKMYLVKYINTKSNDARVRVYKKNAFYDLYGNLTGHKEEYEVLAKLVREPVKYE